MRTLFGNDDYPDNRIWFDGIVDKDFKGSFTCDELVDILFPLFNSIYKKRLKNVNNNCDNIAVKRFLSLLISDKVVNFINSNFYYYPLAWIYCGFGNSVLVDENDGYNDIINFFNKRNKNQKFVDFFPVIANQHAFLLGELDISLFFPNDKHISNIVNYEIEIIEDYFPSFFPLHSYCTFLLENGSVLITEKLAYERNLYAGYGSSAYFHKIIKDVVKEKKKYNCCVYSLNCLNYVVHNLFRDLFEADREGSDEFY